MAESEHTFEIAMSEFDWQFIKIATEQGLVSDVDLLRVLMHETSLPTTNENRPTVPQLLLDKQILTYEQIDAVLKQMFGRGGDTPADGSPMVEAETAACTGAD